METPTEQVPHDTKSAFMNTLTRSTGVQTRMPILSSVHQELSTMLPGSNK